MIGKIKSFSFFVAMTTLMLLGGCSSKSYIFGEQEGFCQDCGYQYKGVCANPMDIYYNSDIIVDKPATCDKKKTERVGARD